MNQLSSYDEEKWWAELCSCGHARIAHQPIDDAPDDWACDYWIKPSLLCDCRQFVPERDES